MDAVDGAEARSVALHERSAGFAALQRITPRNMVPGLPLPQYAIENMPMYAVTVLVLSYIMLSPRSYSSQRRMPRLSVK